jgi:hypothetical protein
MATPTPKTVSTIQAYFQSIKSIYTKIDQIKESNRNTLNYLMSTTTESQCEQAMATVHTSTLVAIELLTTELSEKQAYLGKLKHTRS